MSPPRPSLHVVGRRLEQTRPDRHGGFILTGPDLPALFAAGDVRHGSTKRVAGAVGEGAMAVTLAYRRLEELRQEA